MMCYFPDFEASSHELSLTPRHPFHGRSWGIGTNGSLNIIQQFRLGDESGGLEGRPNSGRANK